MLQLRLPEIRKKKENVSLTDRIGHEDNFH
jgi:hypothetical protein